MAKSTAARVLYWFRTDLRITDSPALQAALNLPERKIDAFYPIWCWDPNYIYGHRVGLNRFSFLLESMQALSDELTSLNPKQKLHVMRGPPEEVLPVLWSNWGITHLVYEKDSNGYAVVRDQKVKKLAEEKGVQVIEVHGRHLFDPELVVKQNGGKATMTLHTWQTVSLGIFLGGTQESNPVLHVVIPDRLGNEQDGTSGTNLSNSR